MDMSKINRALGRIEGIGLGLGGTVGEDLQHTASLIGREIEAEHRKKMEKNREEETNQQEPECIKRMTSAEIMELTDRLRRHYLNHVEGKTQNYSRICNDCVRAADLIEWLLEERENRDFGKYAGEP